MMFYHNRNIELAEVLAWSDTDCATLASYRYFLRVNDKMEGAS